MKIQNLRNRGFTLVEIMIVVAIIGLLAAIAIPNFVKARESSQTGACLANLTQILRAKASWAMETKQGNSATPLDADLFGPTAYLRAKPECPAGGSYTLRAMNLTPVCSESANGHQLP